MQLFLVVFTAIIVEGLVTYAKTFFTNAKFQWQQLVSVVLGVVVALAYNVDIFSMFGIVSVVPYIGSVLTGVLISRGSNYIFDLVKQLTAAKTDNS
jgi:hypothetical protein